MCVEGEENSQSTDSVILHTPNPKSRYLGNRAKEAVKSSKIALDGSAVGCQFNGHFCHDMALDVCRFIRRSVHDVFSSPVTQNFSGHHRFSDNR